jgi:hypothetical protein
MIQFTKSMKPTHIFGITILLISIIAGILIISAFNQPIASAQNLGADGMRAQVTSTPDTEDHSVIGSTDGIVVMGFLIVCIIITPLLFRRKRTRSQ